MEHPVSLLIAWRERAAHLQQFGDPNSARLWMLAAAELERALATVADETLSLVEAARVSGFTPDYLGHLVKTKKIKNCSGYYSRRPFSWGCCASLANRRSSIG